MLKNRQDLINIRQIYANAIAAEKKRILVCGGTGCVSSGSLDVFAGVAKRAPDIFIKLGLEWFYRLLKQPSRIGRMMKLPKFLLIVIKERLFGRKGK